MATQLLGELGTLAVVRRLTPALIKRLPLAVAGALADQNGHGGNLTSRTQALCWCSGSWFLPITTKCLNLVAKLLGTLHVPTREGHRQGKFKFFELMVTLRHTMARGGRGSGRAAALAGGGERGGL